MKFIDVEKLKAQNYVALSFFRSNYKIFNWFLFYNQETSFNYNCLFQPQQNIPIFFLDIWCVTFKIHYFDVVSVCIVLMVLPHDAYCVWSQPLCKVTIGVALVVVVEWVLRPLIRSKTCVEGSSGCMCWISLCTCHQIREAQWFCSHTAGAAGRIHESVGHWLWCSVNR